MTWYKPNKMEWISFLAVMPFLCTGCNYLLFGPRFLDTEVLLKSNAIMYPVGFVAWYNHVAFTDRINRKYAHFSQINQRVAWLLVVHIIVIASSFSVYFIGYDYFDFLGYRLDMQKYVWGLICAFYITSVLTTIWGLTYSANQLKKGLVAKEELEHQNLQTELDMLRNRVSPHFLYNSLNSLSPLIEEDQKEAERFVDELSKVFRYLLAETENGLTTLASELDFLHAYFYLLRKRYGAGIDLSVEVDDRWFDHLLPTHTLQVLVENAVKYNSVNKQTTLRITVSVTGAGQLCVENNLQKKIIRIDESGFGLSRIRSRYRLLKREGVNVLETRHAFLVEVPLIASVG